MIEIDNIYLGDCLELMQEMDDKSVDAVICDLPYGVTGNAWDSVLPFEKLWAQYKRITKENSAIVLFAAEPFATMLRMSNMKQYRYDWIWQKHVPVGFLNSNIRPLRAYENICVFYCQQPTYNPQGLRPANRRVERTGPGGNYGEIKNNSYTAKYTGYPTDVLYFETDKTHYHPTQKPVNLIRYLIRTYTNRGGGNSG